MRTAFKICLVAGGFVGAFLIALAAVAIRMAHTNGPDAQASSGMYAFGDFYLFITAFGFLALLPTGAALYFLRTHHRFWGVLSALGLGVAISGAPAAILFALGRHALSPSPLSTWADLSVLRILLAPILAPAFLLVTLLTPHRFPRLALAAATVVEAAVVAYAGFVWFLPLFLNRR